MTSGNVVSDSSIVVVRADRAEQMRLYDSLPLRWRRLIDDLPVPQDLREVVAVLARFGEVVGYGLIVETYKGQYPGWTPSGEGG